MVGYGVGGALALAALVVVIILAPSSGSEGGTDAKAAEVFPSGGSFPKQTIFDVKPAAQAAGCELKSVKANSRQHTTSLSDHVKYSTNPPTTGRHYQIPA